jgi:hypothetical protein
MAKSKPITTPGDGEPGLDPFDITAPTPLTSGPTIQIDPTPRNAPAPDEIAMLRQEMDGLKNLVLRLAAATPAAHPAQPADTEDVAKAKAIYQQTLAEVAKTSEQRTQAVVDRSYPRAAGDTVFEVVLKDKPAHDGNGNVRFEVGAFPRLRIPAPKMEDAKGRYAAVCGIISSGDAPFAMKELAV